MTEQRTAYYDSPQHRGNYERLERERNAYRATLGGILRYVRRELGGRPPTHPDTILYQVYVAAARAIDDNGRSMSKGSSPSTFHDIGSRPSKLNGGRTQRASGASR